MTEAPNIEGPDRWPETQQLILLVFHRDEHVAHLAGLELLRRLDWPAIPLAHEGRCKTLRRE